MLLLLLVLLMMMTVHFNRILMLFIYLLAQLS
jgi:hypothetical protein